MYIHPIRKWVGFVNYNEPKQHIKVTWTGQFGFDTRIDKWMYY